MSTNEREDKTIYKVVVNHEEQYSIWPAQSELGQCEAHLILVLPASITVACLAFLV